jgi:hypothetical protein
MIIYKMIVRSRVTRARVIMGKDCLGVSRVSRNNWCRYRRRGELSKQRVMVEDNRRGKRI